MPTSLGCRGAGLDGATPQEGFWAAALLRLGIPEGFHKLFVQLCCFCFLFLRRWHQTHNKMSGRKRRA